MIGIASDDHFVSTNDSWLLNIMDTQDPPRVHMKPRIQKVPQALREIESNRTCFDPWVVSFGPCHHGEDRLKPMESIKEAAARCFVLHLTANSPGIASNQRAAKNVYDKFVEKAPNFSELRDCYADDITQGYDEAEFMKMMFLDGCLILWFIDPCEYMLNISPLDVALILRDMFLLENQIPYAILETLMSLMPEKNEHEGKSSNSQSNGSKELIKQFIQMLILTEYKSSSSFGCFTYITKLLKKFSNIFTDMNVYSRHNNALDSTGGGSNSASGEEPYEPIHLLDFLRFILVGKDKYYDRPGYSNYYCRSIKDLKAAGIKLKRSNSKNLRDIKFTGGLIQGCLHLPQLEVNDNTKSHLLNLVAYEMCSDVFSDFVVTTYVSFLESLIDHAEDVKELRSKRILLNKLGSDEEVAKLFNEIGTQLVPDSNTYSDVMQQIEAHSRSKVKVWFGEFMHTHFSSPWTVIALLAVTSLLILTLIQTIYSARGYIKEH